MNKTYLIGAAAASVALILSGCSASASAGGGASASFPEAGSTIEWIVPSAAGAGNDILARIVAPVMQEELGANVKVVNKEGGSQIVGLNYLANAKPDGLTIGATNVPSIIGRYLDPTKNAGFDRDSFIPVGAFATNAVVIGVAKDSPYTSVEDLFEAVEKKPGEITAATDSRAGDDHVNLRILEDELDLDFNIVHYNSGADKVSAVLASEVDFALGGVSSFYGQYLSGDIRLLAIVSEEESSFVPDVPTLASAGYEVDPMNSNFVVSVPAETPADTVAALEAALETAAESPDVIDKLEGAATEPKWLSGAEVATLWDERESAIKPIIDELLIQN
ncbi:MAG: hypothetical protein JWQ43_1640 [Glaciihabitans sp.]|nr:hypothetical protein [Glaciihabitans sp.]